MVRLKSRIPKPPPPDKAYLDDYWYNWWCLLTRREPNSSARARCVGCGVRGILGYELLHYGPTRPTNLFCRDCVPPRPPMLHEKYLENSKRQRRIRKG